MSIVGKSGTILAIDGTIRDDSDPCKCCKDCPACHIDYRRYPTGNPKCKCIPLRFLAVVAGVGVGCSCTIGDVAPGPPHGHFEVTATSYGGAYCFGAGGGTKVLAFPFALWGNDSPTDDCNNATLVDFGLRAELTLSVTFGGLAVVVEATVTGFYNSGGGVEIFHALISNQSCVGPWVLSGGGPIACGYNGVSYSVGSTPGTITVYPCHAMCP